MHITQKNSNIKNPNNLNESNVSDTDQEINQNTILKDENKNDDNMYEFTLFYPETIPWDYMKQRPQHLLYNLSKQNIFIYYLDNRVETYKFIKNNLVIISPKLFKQLYADNNIKIYGKLVYYFSQSSFVTYVDICKPDLVYYDYVDNDENEFAVWEPWMREVMTKANIISCTAPILQNKLYNKHKFEGPSILIPNACNYSDFSLIPDFIPEDLKDFREKHNFIIGYYGALATWMDIDLVMKIVEHFPVVMIGKMTQINGYQTVTIPPHKNLLLLDAKPYDQLYKYSYYFDIGMIPFKLTNMIQCCDPCKFYEYIAMGKPVIATKMNPLERFADCCHFIDDNNVIDIIDNIKNNPPDSKYLKSIAINNTWFLRSIDMYNFIKIYL